MATSLPDFKTRAEAAEICGVCIRTIDNVIRAGELPAYRLGGVKIKLADLLAWIETKKKKVRNKRNKPPQVKFKKRNKRRPLQPAAQQ